MEEQQLAPKKRPVARRILGIVLKIFLGIILLFALIAVLIITPPVQNFIKNKATTWLSKKLDTKVSIGKIYIGFPKKIVLENIYVEDKTKDTLLAGGKVKVDIAMMQLLHSKVEVNQVKLEGITAKVKRVLPDTVYNFQFIVDAFATGDTTTANPNDSSSMKISVRNVELDKIRLVYDDDITGNDVTVWLEHFDTEIDVFDLDNMRFRVPSTNIKGINANIYQRKPLVEPAEVADTAQASAPVAVDFNFGEFNLKNIKVDYGNDVSAFYTKLDLENLQVESDNIDLKNQNVALKQIRLDNTTAVVRLGKTPSAELVAKKAEQVAEKTSAPGEDSVSGWRVTVKNIRLDNNNLAFSNDNEPVLKRGMDYAHIDAKGVTLHADDFLFSPDSIAGSITKGEIIEKSGFQLNALETDFLYANNEAYLRNLLLKTPGTVLRRSAAIRYPSIDALQKDIGKMQMDINLANSTIQVKDILIFAPFLDSLPALANPRSTFTIDGSITGRVADMNINKFVLRGLNNTVVDVNGKISGLPDSKKLNGNLTITNISTSRKDIELLAPKGSLPTNITLPSTLKLAGNIAGNMNDARADLNLNTNLGSASINGRISNPTDSIRAKYNANIITHNLDLGVIMQNDTMFGPITANITAQGTGYALKTANGKFNGTINSAVLNRYNYKNAKLDGALANQKGNFKFNINDPNITIDLDADADLSAEFPSIRLNAVIDSISTKPLNFTTDTLVYKGNITADFANTDPANLDGKLFVTKSQLLMGGQRYALDTISLTSGKTDTGKFLQLNTDGINVALTGKYNLAQLGSAFEQTIQPYYALGKTPNKDTIEDYDFNFRADINNSPTLKAFVPGLRRLDPITMNGHFATNEGFNASLDAPLILIGTNRIQKLKFNAGTKNNAIDINTNLEQLAVGESLTIYTTNADAKIADNKINFLLNFKDVDNKNKYRLGGLFEQPQPGTYAFSLQPGQLLLNYDKWNISDSNIIKIDSSDINVSNFTLSKTGQQLSVNSTSAERNSPLEIKFGNFRIGTLTAFAKQDTALVDGTMNGNIVLKNIATQPTFVGDLTVTNLMSRKDTVGTLTVKVNNNTANVYNADIQLTGRGNDLRIGGDYIVNPGSEGQLDLTMDIRRLEMSSVEALSMGAITKGTGYLNGRFDINGTAAKPGVVGQLNFNRAGFIPTMLGSYFTIDKESIRVNAEGIHFDNFTIRDSAKNELNLDGWARTTNFTNYKLDLDLTAENFQALNSTKQDNKLFYGKFYFDTDLHIGGTEQSPKVDGDLVVNEKTDMTIVMPSDQPGVVEREGIVRFIDADSLKMDTTLQMTAVDSLGKSGITGMDIAVNIETKKEAKFTLVIDEGNGDFLEMQGTAQLTGGIDPSGKTTLTGNYQIEKGAYQLSVNLLKRRFEIQKGSKITWLGEPTRADVDLTAIYVAKTAPITLIEDQATVSNMNIFKQKLPFNVNLILKGELLKPDISFDVRLPSEDSVQLNVSSEVTETVDTRLAQLRAQPSELNKQVFALLLLNRFVAENPFASGGDAMSAETVARQSVSRLLSEQLNNLAADLIAGVDINFDLASSEDYTTGSRQNRTDLNVSVSKELLNDRLRVTVGNNFELEGPQGSSQRASGLAGNVAVDYLLSKDGRYMVRGYRKNEYEGELEGYIIETGLNFILTFDYDRLRELFHSPKEKKIRKKKG